VNAVASNLSLPDPVLTAVDWIERRLAADLRIGEIARECHLSTTQLYRDFHSRTGHTVKEYVRRRRLSNALARVRHSDEALADIALAWGYGTQQSFNKVVKTATGLTPLSYRQDGTEYYFPRYRGGPGRQVTVSDRFFPLTIRLRYARQTADGIEDLAVGDFLRRCPDFDGRLFGRTLPGPELSAGERGLPGGAVYELRAEFRPGLLAALRGGPFTGFATAPAVRRVCAATTAPNEPDAVRTAWDHLYNGWLATSMFEPAGGPLLEEFHITAGRVRRLTLTLPVGKRTGCHRIRLSCPPAETFVTATHTGPRAEEEAARAVLDPVLQIAPGLAGPTATFYISRYGSSCTCGVACPPDTGVAHSLIRAAPDLSRLCLPDCLCAVLEGELCADASVYLPVLASWAEDNGFHPSGASAFVLYRAEGGFGPRQVAVQVYLPLQNDDGKNG
jgi:AraC-like DNA-binding protein